MPTIEEMTAKTRHIFMHQEAMLEHLARCPKYGPRNDWSRFYAAYRAHEVAKAPHGRFGLQPEDTRDMETFLQGYMAALGGVLKPEAATIAQARDKGLTYEEAASREVYKSVPSWVIEYVKDLF